MRSRAVGDFSRLRNSDRLGWYLPLVRRSQYSLVGTFHRRRSRLLKTGFCRQQVRELKIQRKASIYLSLFGPSFPRFLEPGSLLLLEGSKARPFSNTQRTVEFFWHCILLVASDA
jgi:hypothetical protein